MFKCFLINFSFFVIIIVTFSSCDSKKEAKVKHDLNRFEDWLNNQTSTSKLRTDQEWDEIQSSYENFKNEIDYNMDKVSRTTKDRYLQLTNRYAQWKRVTLIEQKTARKTRQNLTPELLGSYDDLSMVTTKNVKEAYVAFLINVRKKHNSWTEPEWDVAEIILSKLNARKDQVDDSLPADDEIKIKALQIEFHTLEAGNKISQSL